MLKSYMQIYFMAAHNASFQAHIHTLSIAFQHLPPNSARFGYATEGTLFTSAQLSVEGRMS